MKVKKQRRHRRAVRFYTTCYGFREPFKVLCDGTFIHHLLLNALTPADDALSRVLGGRATLFSTRCINAELKTLGQSYSESLQAAHQLVTARCDHEKRVSAADCIEEITREGNPEHFFVATQDADLRKKFRVVPGVPVIYGLKNSLFLEQPSAHNRKFAMSIEEKRLHMGDLEYQKLHMRELKDKLATQVTSSPTVDDVLGNDVITKATRNINTASQMLDVADKSKFKRKRAKGPNPLSCKKKKNDDPSVTKKQDGKEDGVTKRRRIRKRKRAHKDSKTGEPGS